MPGGAHGHAKQWEPEEDLLIIEYHGKLGPKWKDIAERLPGRSVASVRNRHQRIEKGRKLREDGFETKNRCHRCGEPRRGHTCKAKLAEVAIPGVDDQAGTNPLLLTNQGPAAPAAAAFAALPIPPPPFVSVATAPPSLHLPEPGDPLSLRRTRSASKLPIPSRLVDMELPPRVSGGLSVGIDISNASGGASGSGGAPHVSRSNTSFFRDLAGGDLFSPGSRDMFQAWADSPVDHGIVLDAVAQHPAAPPSLRRAASLAQQTNDEPSGGVPKITRSLSSFVRELEHGWQEPTIEPHATPFMTLQPTSMLHPPSQPSLSRQVSVTNPASGSLLSSALYRAPSPSGPSRTPSSGSWDLMLPSLKRTRSGSKLNPSWSEDLGFDALR